MDATQLEALVTAAQSIAAVLSQLGVPGLMCLALAGPALIIVAMLYFEHLRAVRQEQQLAAYRADLEQQQAAHRETVEKVMETYRTDMQTMLRDVAKEHAEAVRFYTDNVGLVREYESMAGGMQHIIVNNTRAMERLTTIIETREHV